MRAGARPGVRARVRAWAELLRVSALFTVPGDALAGAAAAGRAPNRGTAYAVGASLCLYEAGMALNDWADREEDAVDRPHRPIPSGRISPTSALLAAGALTAAGLALSARAGRPSLAVAMALSATVWSYDLHFKHTPAGPTAMATARALDLLLGAVATAGRLQAGPPGEPSWGGVVAAADTPLREAAGAVSGGVPKVRRDGSGAGAAARGAVPAHTAVGLPGPRAAGAGARGARAALAARTARAAGQRAWGAVSGDVPKPRSASVLSAHSSGASAGAGAPWGPVFGRVPKAPGGGVRPARSSGAPAARGPVTGTAAGAGAAREAVPARAARSSGLFAAGGDVVRSGAGGALLAAVPAAIVLGAHTYAVTAVSRHEAQGGSTAVPLVALAATLGLGVLVAGEMRGAEGSPAGGSFRRSPGAPATAGALLLAVAYVRTVAKPLLHAALNPSPPLTQRAVGGGIRAMIPLQAALAARAGAGVTALAVMGLVPLARKLARKVSPT
ncbi:UbiA family prenyltransferase [Streptomyces sp. NPDC052236]|uniref:UbiA family prenyltransferase n=1 Tax=Streptomyces sp. NPDC052236 TaxID=3365686 RepID=UPI0037D511F7